MRALVFEVMTAFRWLKYCRYGVILYPINQLKSWEVLYNFQGHSYEGQGQFIFQFALQLHVNVLFLKFSIVILYTCIQLNSWTNNFWYLVNKFYSIQLVSSYRDWVQSQNQNVFSNLLLIHSLWPLLLVFPLFMTMK